VVKALADFKIVTTVKEMWEHKYLPH